MEFHSLVAALQNPEIYPDKPVRVDLVQTHISAVFLAGALILIVIALLPLIRKGIDYGWRRELTEAEKGK